MDMPQVPWLAPITVGKLQLCGAGHVLSACRHLQKKQESRFWRSGRFATISFMWFKPTHQFRAYLGTDC